jgi:hypothetical protein
VFRSLQFAHKRCPKAVAIAVSFSSDSILGRQDTSTNDASDGVEVTTMVDLIFEVFVIGPAFWFATHEVDMPLIWAAEFTTVGGAPRPQ